MKRHSAIELGVIKGVLLLPKFHLHLVMALTVSVCGTALAFDCLDQQHPSTAEWAYLLNADWSYAQTFLVSTGGAIDRVAIAVGTNGMPNAPLLIELKNTSGGLPGSTLASSVVAAANVTGSSYLEVTVEPEGISVVPGQLLAIAVSSLGNTDPEGTDHYYILADESQAYERGAGFASWNQQPEWFEITTENAVGVDFGFQVFLDCSTPIDRLDWAAVKAMYR